MHSSLRPLKIHCPRLESSLAIAWTSYTHTYFSVHLYRCTNKNRRYPVFRKLQHCNTKPYSLFTNGFHVVIATFAVQVNINGLHNHHWYTAGRRTTVDDTLNAINSSRSIIHSLVSALHLCLPFACAGYKKRLTWEFGVLTLLEDYIKYPPEWAQSQWGGLRPALEMA